MNNDDLLGRRFHIYTDPIAKTGKVGEGRILEVNQSVGDRYRLCRVRILTRMYHPNEDFWIDVQDEIKAPGPGCKAVK